MDEVGASLAWLAMASTNWIGGGGKVGRVHQSVSNRKQRLETSVVVARWIAEEGHNFGEHLGRRRDVHAVAEVLVDPQPSLRNERNRSTERASERVRRTTTAEKKPQHRRHHARAHARTSSSNVFTYQWHSLHERVYRFARNGDVPSAPHNEHRSRVLANDFERLPVVVQLLAVLHRRQNGPWQGSVLSARGRKHTQKHTHKHARSENTTETEKQSGNNDTAPANRPTTQCAQLEKTPHGSVVVHRNRYGCCQCCGANAQANGGG